MIDELVKAYEQGKGDYEKYRQTILNIIELLYSFCNTVLKRFLASPVGKRVASLDVDACINNLCVDLSLGIDAVSINVNLEGDDLSMILLELKYELDRETGNLKLQQKYICKTELIYLAEQCENIKKLVTEVAYKLGVLEKYHEDKTL